MDTVGRLKQWWVWFRWRGALLSVTFALGLAGFLVGTEVGGSSPAPASASGVVTLMIHVYHTLGLFVLGGLDLGVPTGGPWYGQAMLWSAYFMAPAITTSALVEGLLRALRPDSWAMSRIHNHTILVGYSRESALCLERLRELTPDAPVVLVDPEPVAAALERVLVVVGDISTDDTLARLRLDYASRVFVLTGDDFLNLDTATRIAQLAPHLENRLVVHLSDLEMVRVVERLGLMSRCDVFNSHRVAAAHLVRTRLIGHFAQTQPRDVVVLAGFGRFGQTLLDELQRQAAGAFELVILIDLEGDAAAATFDIEIGFDAGYQRQIWQSDMKDPALWLKLHKTLKGVVEPVFVLGTGDDQANITAALKLAERFPSAYVVARRQSRSPFVDRVAQDGGFDVVGVPELVKSSMPDSWFT